MRVSARGVVATLLGLAVAGVCARLGAWQLDRLEERRVRNAELEAALALPVLELRDSLAALFSAPERYLNRRVRLRGSYDPAGQVVLRGRVDGGRPGVHLVTPLVVAGDTAVMVNRGWIPSPDGATVDPAPFGTPGALELEGLVMPAPDTRDGDPARATFARLPLDSLRAASARPLLPVYVQRLPHEIPADTLPRAVPVPSLDEGPHLGYAVQWFSFAAIALIGLALLLRRGLRGVP